MGTATAVDDRQEHEERHSEANVRVRDIVIGLADGLTVPFALAAGLSGAVSSTRLVVLAGLAEIAAGSIAMGLGGYLAARSDEQHFAAELARERREVVEKPQDEEEEIYEVFSRYGIDRPTATPVLRALQANPKAYVDFMMRFELGLETPVPGRAWRSAVTIAVSYIVGGLVPLTPYMLLRHQPGLALLWSIATTLLALILFGIFKGRALNTSVWRSALQTAGIGSLAAAAAFGLARLLSATT